MPSTETFELVRRPRGLWDRIVRSFTIGPMSLKDPALARLFGASPNSAGVSVTEATALNLSAVWAAVNLISGDVSSLPLVLYKRLPTRGKERYDSHPLYRILHDSPNPEMTSITFRRTLQAHALTWGGGFSEIERDGAGRPKHLWPITPDRVRVERDGAALVYIVSNPKGGETRLSASEVFHLHGLGYDGATGYSVIAKAREAIGLGMAAERFGGTFFGNGASFGGVFEHPNKMSDLARKNFKESIDSRHQGVDRAHKFLVVEEGMKYQRLGIPPEDAQFLETRQFQVTEIARWFSVPPHKIGDLSRATFSNIEQQTIDYFQTTLQHWLRTWEQELTLKLVAPLERTQQAIEHVVEGLLRGDAQGRAEYYGKLFSIGAITPNEIRALENMNPIEGGDTPYVPVNMVPADRVNEVIDHQVEPTPKPAPAPDPAKDDDRAVVVLTKRLEEAAATVATAQGETAAEREKREAAESAAAAALVAKADAEARRAESDALVQALRGEVTAAEADARLADEQRGVASAATADAEGAVVKATAAADVLRENLARAEADLATARQAHRDAEVALVEERGARVADQSASAEERQRLAAAVDAAALKSAEAEQAVLMANGARDAAIASLTAADAARQLAEAEVKRQTETLSGRDAAVIAAHRAMVVDVVQRVLTKETDRARRHQATREKLRAWMETFYPDHVETMAGALRPVLAAILAWRQGDTAAVDAWAESVALAHCEQSQQQLRAVLAVDEYPQQFERLLQRWDERRSTALADVCLREDVAHVHRG